MININVREYQTANIKKTIQRNWQHKTKKNKTKNTICVGQHYTQTSIKNTNTTCSLLQRRHAPSYKPLMGKTNRRSFLFCNRKGHYNTELRT